jgi:ribosome recycling factor
MDLTLAKAQMQRILDVLRGDLATVRTGRATPSLIENIVVSVYGNTAKLKVMEVATIAASDPQTLVITPFDGSIIGEIQKGIEVANIGLTPVMDGALIRISIPPLSQERREQLISLMKQKLENGKVMVRQARQDAMKDIKKQEISEDEQSRIEKEIQKITDETIEQIESLGKAKEAELLQI